MFLILKALVVSFMVSSMTVLTITLIERRRAIKAPPKEAAKEWLGGFLLLTPIFMIVFSLDPTSTSVDDLMDRYPARVISSGIILAGLLFALRQRRGDVYGMLEIGVALVILYTFAVHPFPGLIAFIVGFATPVYIIIRGLDNITKYWSSSSASKRLRR